ncbi:MAG: hypothetical protein JWO57_527 [Pseudonocardiales bacterium]|nr:hypothetical protein [Pseudonocardiales bacterium]
MTVDPSSLTTDQLNTYITSRLVVSGIDISLLPTAPDPVTGAPTQAQALASLRSFVLSNPKVINGWRPAPAAGTADAGVLSQELVPPLEYPSITEAWTGQVQSR